MSSSCGAGPSSPGCPKNLSLFLYSEEVVCRSRVFELNVGLCKVEEILSQAFQQTKKSPDSLKNRAQEINEVASSTGLSSEAGEQLLKMSTSEDAIRQARKDFRLAILREVGESCRKLSALEELLKSFYLSKDESSGSIINNIKITKEITNLAGFSWGVAKKLLNKENILDAIERIRETAENIWRLSS
jgi:hypothetical protein